MIIVEPKKMYVQEIITNASITHSTKIGLMYASKSNPIRITV